MKLNLDGCVYQILLVNNVMLKQQQPPTKVAIKVFLIQLVKNRKSPTQRLIKPLRHNFIAGIIGMDRIAH